jgi:hypothetical protein
VRAGISGRRICVGAVLERPPLPRAAIYWWQNLDGSLAGAIGRRGLVLPPARSLASGSVTSHRPA